MQHHFDVEIALRYGVAEAVLLNHFEYWIELNRANEKNFFDGRYWTFNSMKAFAEIFPYLTEKKIRNALKHLQDEGLILTGNFNKSAYDRTLWYAFSDLADSILPKGQMDFSETANGFTQKGRPIPDNNTDNNPYNNTDKKVRKRTNTQPKEKHGEYGWVKLTDEQHSKLTHDYGEAEVNRAIQYVDESAQSSGNKNKWKDWNLVVRRCIREGWGKKAPAETIKRFDPQTGTWS